MALRYNNFQIDHFDTNDQGVMTVTAIARVPGVLVYKNADGSLRRELVSREFLRRVDSDGRPLIAGLANIPVVNEHPPCLIKNNDALEKQYAVGRTKNDIHVYSDGKVQVTFDVFDPTTQDDIRSGRKDGVSLGYATNVKYEPGVWHGEHFDAKQDEPIDEDHLAVCKNPRAFEARIKRFDSAEDIAWQVDSLPHTPMTTATIPRTDAEQMYQIELMTPEGKVPFMVPLDLYKDIKRLGLDDCECHADSDDDLVLVHETKQAQYHVDSEGILWRFDKATGKSKECPGGYRIPVGKNCRSSTAAKKGAQSLNKFGKASGNAGRQNRIAELKQKQAKKAAQKERVAQKLKQQEKGLAPQHRTFLAGSASGKGARAQTETVTGSKDLRQKKIAQSREIQQRTGFSTQQMQKMQQKATTSSKKRRKAA